METRLTVGFNEEVNASPNFRRHGDRWPCLWVQSQTSGSLALHRREDATSVGPFIHSSDVTTYALRVCIWLMWIKRGGFHHEFWNQETKTYKWFSETPRHQFAVRVFISSHNHRGLANASVLLFFLKKKQRKWSYDLAQVLMISLFQWFQ